MDEKRMNKRSDLSTNVELTLINGKGKNLKLDAEILNVSKDGVGFLAKEPLMIGAIYKSNIRLWTGQTIDCMLKIIRAVDEGDGDYSYGCLFVGMPDLESMRILIYQMFEANPEG